MDSEDYKVIERSSPLYFYWQSSQNEREERHRLLKANLLSPYVDLFREEPYKWEILFQTIVREINEGEEVLAMGLKLLMDTIALEERNKTLKALTENDLLGEHLLSQIIDQERKLVLSKGNLLRTIRVLNAIFFNPYGIEIRRRRFLYEHTGFIANSFRKILCPKGK